MADLFGMLQAAAGNAGEDIDPNFNQTVLLLHGDGTNGAQNNTFLDSSTNNFTITRAGNTTQGTFSPFSVGAGQWSNFFDGTDDALAAAGSTDFQFGTGDFCVEAFVYLNATTQQGIAGTYDGANGGWWFYVDTGTVLAFRNGDSGVVTRSYSFTVGTWYHVAVTRSSSTLRFFVNGTQVGVDENSYTQNITRNNTNGCAIGRAQLSDNSAGSYINGYISNLRVVKGSPVYTGSYTTPTEPLTAITNTQLLTCQSYRFVDSNTQVSAKTISVASAPKVTPFSPFAPTAAYDASVNGGSGYFDGTGDYLTTPYNAAFNFGAPSGNTNDFVVEGWFYPTGTAIYLLFGTTYSASNYWALLLNRSAAGGGTNTPGRVELYLTDSSVIATGTDSGLLPFQWNHIAAVRTGTTVSIFVNGTRQGTTTTSTNPNPNGSLEVGKSTVLDRDFLGWMSGIRIFKGSTIPYDATSTTLTLPSAPPTAITNTQVLLNFTNAGIFDNTGKNNLETVGNAQIDTSEKKYGTGSMEFDGTGDYLMAKPNPELEIGSGDYTIECWVNVSAAAANGGIVSKGPVGSLTNTTWSIEFDGANNTLSYFVYNANNSAYIINTTTNVKTSTWVHVAVTRSGNNTKFFINGTQEGSTYTSGYTIAAGDNLYIGGGFYAPTTRTITGYIDDLRITKGIARYTAAFTPPAQAFPNI